MKMVLFFISYLPSRIRLILLHNKFIIVGIIEYMFAEGKLKLNREKTEFMVVIKQGDSSASSVDLFLNVFWKCMIFRWIVILTFRQMKMVCANTNCCSRRSSVKPLSVCC